MFSEHVSMLVMDDLPEEIIGEIVSHVPSTSLTNVSEVSLLFSKVTAKRVHTIKNVNDYIAVIKNADVFSIIRYRGMQWLYCAIYAAVQSGDELMLKMIQRLNIKEKYVFPRYHMRRIIKLAYQYNSTNLLSYFGNISEFIRHNATALLLDALKIRNKQLAQQIWPEIGVNLQGDRRGIELQTCLWDDPDITTMVTSLLPISNMVKAIRAIIHEDWQTYEMLLPTINVNNDYISWIVWSCIPCSTVRGLSKLSTYHNIYYDLGHICYYVVMSKSYELLVFVERQQPQIIREYHWIICCVNCNEDYVPISVIEHLLRNRTQNIAENQLEHLCSHSDYYGFKDIALMFEETRLQQITY